MIPILYPKGATKTDTTTTNGLGALVDCIKCEVTEERNGIYELSMQYPITGARFTEIAEGALIKAKPNDKSAPQLFRIYKSSAPLKGIVTYSAEHISYDLNGLPLPSLVAENVSAEIAMRRALIASPLDHDFAAYSDITTLNSIVISKPTTQRSALGGTAGGFLDTYGGEFEFDNYDVHLWKDRGANNGVMLRYGKNITDIKQEQNIASCYTHIFPYAIKTETAEDGTPTGTETVLTLSEGVLPLINPADVGHTRALNVDFSGDFSDGDQFDEATLRALAEEYAATAELYAPAVNITLSFVNLAQTEDYKDIAPLEKVGLCDTVNVYFEKLNISAHAKVIKTVYDTLKEKYNKIEVGSVKANFARTVKNIITSVQNAEAAAAAGDALLTSRLIVESERITAEISRASKAEGVLSTSIEAQAGKLALIIQESEDGENSIKAAEIITAINEDESEITLSADKINLNGAVSANGTFKITTDGNIVATGGSVGGYDISETDLTASGESDIATYKLIITADDEEYGAAIKTERKYKTMAGVYTAAITPGAILAKYTFANATYTTSIMGDSIQMFRPCTDISGGVRGLFITGEDGLAEDYTETWGGGVVYETTTQGEYFADKCAFFGLRFRLGSPYFSGIVARLGNDSGNVDDNGEPIPTTRRLTLLGSRIDCEGTSSNGSARVPIYASAFNTSSDERVKKDITDISEINKGIFDRLCPRQFKYKASDQLHFGFIAQQVAAAIEEAGGDPAAYGAISYPEDDGDHFSLCYEEFIALCVYEIQQLKAEINELKTAKNAE